MTADDEEQDPGDRPHFYTVRELREWLAMFDGDDVVVFAWGDEFRDGVFERGTGLQGGMKKMWRPDRAPDEEGPVEGDVRLRAGAPLLSLFAHEEGRPEEELVGRPEDDYVPCVVLCG